ncbi:MAG TPA: S8 family serine peptidase, partial [Marmoricola sp.]
WHSSGTASRTISGTSMAAPHVTGAVARYLEHDPTATPASVSAAVVSSATAGVVPNPGSGAPNRLLHFDPGSEPLPPPPVDCTTGFEVFEGSLSGNGDADIQPGGTYFQSSVPGIFEGCLDGPPGVDFDLALYKWNGSWSRVAVSQGPTADESVAYAGSAGRYAWRVYSYVGSGSYTFGMHRP